MPTKYRKPATGSDARAKKRTRPNADSIAAAMRYWQKSFAGTRPPPTNDNATGQGGEVGADQNTNESAKNTAKVPQAQPVSHALARMMPRAAAALLTNGAIITGLGQALPAVAVAVSGVLR